MNRFTHFLRFFFLSGILIFILVPAMAQRTDTAFKDYNLLKNTTVWAASNNENGLQFLPIKKISLVQLKATKATGGFKNYYESSGAFNMGAYTESITRLSKKTILQGSVQYDNFRGKEMQGSALINPYTHPLGFEENADTTFGTKKLETYSLRGTISSSLSKKFFLGGHLSYNVGDYAKLKDLRHVNRLLDLNTGSSVLYKVSNKVEFGLSYNYKRRIESLHFEVDGNTDKQYLVFINYGNFYGRTELFGENGLTDDQRPFVNNTHEVSMQLVTRLSPKINLLTELQGSIRAGYYGKKGTTAIMFTQHTANAFVYKGLLNYQNNKNLHVLKWQGNYETLTNMENVYRRETGTGGNTIIAYYGQNEVFSQQLLTLSAKYSGFFKMANYLPVWTLDVNGDFFNRIQTATIFPYYRDQDFTNYAVQALVGRNTMMANALIHIEIGLKYTSGNGTLKYDGFYIPPSLSQKAPTSRDRYLNQEFEYFTKPQVTILPSIGWHKKMDNNGVGFIKFSAALTKAMQVVYLKPGRSIFEITIGCSF